MSRPSIKWGQLERYLNRNGFEIYSQGGDKLIKAPSDGNPNHKRLLVRIGHNFCGHAGDELRNGHLSSLKRNFGVTREMILGE